MCLILLGWQAHPDYALVVAANRDEFHSRPSSPAAFWEDHPAVLGGRDQREGGTWLGVTRSGRFTAVTNYRDPAQFEVKRASRGWLTRDYLVGSTAPHDYLHGLLPTLSRYNDFNLLAGDARQLYCLESRTATVIPLQPGIYGLSNHLFDTPWPKVLDGKAGLARCLAALPAAPAEATAPPAAAVEQLMELLADRTPYADDLLPETGIPLARERQISASFILDPEYGTRSTTVLLLRHDGTGSLHERRFAADGTVTGQSGIMFG